MCHPFATAVLNFSFNPASINQIVPSQHPTIKSAGRSTRQRYAVQRKKEEDMERAKKAQQLEKERKQEEDARQKRKWENEHAERKKELESKEKAADAMLKAYQKMMDCLMVERSQFDKNNENVGVKKGKH